MAGAGHHLSRRGVLAAGTMLAGGSVFAGGLLGGPLRAQTPSPLPAFTPRRFVVNVNDLGPQVHYMLPTGSIMPTGWLQQQVRLQALGLCGNLDIIADYKEVGAGTSWTGAYTDVRAERTPYWLDGLVPLSYMVDDPTIRATLQQKVKRWLGWVLGADGRIRQALQNAYEEDDNHNKIDFCRGWWPAMPMLKAMAQYYELTNDGVVLDRMYGYLDAQCTELETNPFTGWASYRWQEQLHSITWLYNRLSDGGNADEVKRKRDRLMTLAGKLMKVGANLTPGGSFEGSFDWVGKFSRDRADMATPVPGPRGPMWKHGVNVGQALKTPAVLSLFPSGGVADRRGMLNDWLSVLYANHGLPSGMFSCCEHLAGHNPSGGSETCTVAETMYSLELALAIDGDAKLADRIEKIAFNGLPAGLDTNMRTRQYDSQCNQVNAMGAGAWSTDEGNAVNLFSLAGVLGCCTANHSQAWPKFVNSMWMGLPSSQTAPEGLVVALYGPSTVTTIIQDRRVVLKMATDYPFRKSVTITLVELEGAAPLSFPLKLRCPAWSTMKIGSDAVSPDANGWTTRMLTWTAGKSLTITFASDPVIRRNADASVTFTDGPLVYAQRIQESVRKRGQTHPWQTARSPDPTTAPSWTLMDYDLLNPDAVDNRPSGEGWSYAYVMNSAVSDIDTAFDFADSSPPPPFHPDHPRCFMDVDLFKVAEGGWPMVRDDDRKFTVPTYYAAAPPALRKSQLGAAKTVRLQPYGSTRLRLSAFPVAT